MQAEGRKTVECRENMNPRQAADYLGIGRNALFNAMYRENGIPYVRLSPRNIIFVKSAVDEWLHSEAMKNLKA